MERLLDQVPTNPWRPLPSRRLLIPKPGSDETRPLPITLGNPVATRNLCPDVATSGRDLRLDVATLPVRDSELYQQHVAKFRLAFFHSVELRCSPTMLTGYLAGRLLEA